MDVGGDKCTDGCRSVGACIPLTGSTIKNDVPTMYINVT